MSDGARLDIPLGEAIYSLRAIRRLRTDPIPEADLREILEAAIRAPSGGNVQPWHFIAVTDRATLERFGPLYHEAWWAKRADQGIRGPEDIAESNKTARSAMRLADEMKDVPCVVLVCALAKGRGAAESVIPATQNLLLAARSLGIGGTITTLHAKVDERIHELFGIPESAQVVYAVPLGYPRGRFGATVRKPLREVTSLNRWGETPPWA